MRTLGNAALLAGVLIAASCQPPTEAPTFTDAATQMRWNPGHEDFWDLPMPSDLRREDDGSYDLERWPGPWDNELLVTWLRGVNARMTSGWGLSSGAFLPLSGAVDAGSLPEDPEAAAAEGASVFLVDISDGPERGRMFPATVREITELDIYTPEHLLAVLPTFGFVRRPSTAYAVVLTSRVHDAEGQALGPSRAFFDAWHATDDADASAVEHLAPLRAFLESGDNATGATVDEVVGAAVFKTFDPNADLLKLATWYERELPAPQLSGEWTVAESYTSYQVLTNTYEVPLAQTGDRPYTGLGEGLLVWGEDGWPVIQERQQVRLALTVPKQPMPEGGFPLTLYMHGSGGEWYQAINRGPVEELPPEERSPPYAGQGPAEWLARRGVATLAFDFPLHGDRSVPSDTSGLLLYNLLGNIEATLDNFNVAAAEQVYLSKLATSMTVDASLADTLDAGGAADGLIRFNGDRLTMFGQSMGTTLGVAWATVDPRVDGLLLSGAGGILVEIAVTAVEPFPFKGTLETLIELDTEVGLHVGHPMLHALQNLWDFVDPIAKARHISAEPHPGMQAKHVMMTAGIFDGYFYPRSQAAMAAALQVDLVGDEVEPVLPEILRMSGRDTATFPLKDNAHGKTMGVVQFASPYTLGHYVVFNQEGARHVYTCFLASVGSDAGASISAPAAIDTPCP
jgi:hypothetical protein